MRLHDELRDHLPASLGPSQRLTALLVAADANDDTRRGWPGMDDLLTWTGLTEASVRRIITDLEAAGVLERVPVGTDRAGCPIYAHRGQRTVLRVLPLASDGSGKAIAGEPHTGSGDAERGGKGLTGKPQLSTKALAGEPHRRKKGAHQQAERGSPAIERGSPAITKGLTSKPPLVSISSVSSESRHPRATPERAAVVDALRARTGREIDGRQADAVITQLIGDRDDIRNPVAYLRSAINRDPDPGRFLPTPIPPRFQAVPGSHA
jgi:hypothetical protein